jgi:GntR family transcriptional regulator
VLAFRLDHQSGVPAYLQVVQQVEQALRLGHLRPGDQLPTVKEIVQRLAINQNTVLKAYRELEHRGLVEAQPGQGTFVREALPGPSGPSGREQAALRTGLTRWLHRAFEAGLDADTVLALVAAALREMVTDGVTAPAGGTAASAHRSPGPARIYWPVP